MHPHQPRGQPKPATKSIPRVELRLKCFKHILNSSWAGFPVDVYHLSHKGVICIPTKQNYLSLCKRNSFMASSQFRPLISFVYEHNIYFLRNSLTSTWIKTFDNFPYFASSLCITPHPSCSKLSKKSGSEPHWMHTRGLQQKWRWHLFND